MKKAFVVDIISCLFILLFLYTGIIKLIDPDTFRVAIRKSFLIKHWDGFIGYAIPLWEVITALFLLIPFFIDRPLFRKLGLYSSAVLMTLFTFYVGFMLKTAKGNLPCTCGGIIQKMNWHQHLYFNTLFTVMAFIGIWLNRQQYRQIRNSMAFTILLFLILPMTSCRSEADKGELLPSFNLLLIDSTTRINTGQISGGQPIALLYFSPGCEHCQEETASLIKHIDSLKHVKFYFVTIDDFDQMKSFNAYYKLNQYPNIVVGKDEQFFFMRHFKDVFPPYMVVYDQHKRQKMVYDGTVEASTLIKLVNNL